MRQEEIRLICSTQLFCFSLINLARKFLTIFLFFKEIGVRWFGKLR